MNINPVQLTTLINSKQKYTLKNKKKKAILFAGAGLIVAGGLIALACYNKHKILKDTAKKCIQNGKENITNLCKTPHTDTNTAVTDKIKSEAQIRKEKFLELCKSSKPENYVASKENIQNKTFRFDLHSHSNHSDGWGNVSKLLNQVADYADELYAQTGQKFNFALTDHDRVSGVREANKIIRANPEKFKNLNFIPGVELSFAFNSNNKVKTGELLAYNIDPDSKSMKTLVEDLNKNREKMITDCIEKLGDGFSRSDMDNYFLNRDGETFAYNLHYRLRNYAQIKNRVNNMKENKALSADLMYKYLMDGYVFNNGGKRVPKPFVSPDGFDEYLKSKGIKISAPITNEKIDKICDEFFPKIINGKVVSETENGFEKIISVLKGDDSVVLGFAHPYFTAKQMSNYKKEFSDLLKIAEGKIRLSENYHQAYSPNISKTEINDINKFLSEMNLIPIGGRDNHSASFFNNLK